MDNIKARTAAVAHSLLYISRSHATPAAAAAAWATGVGFIKHDEQASLELQVQHFNNNFPLMTATLVNEITQSAQIKAWQRADAAALTDLNLLLDNMSAQLETLQLQPDAAVNAPLLAPDAPEVPAAIAPVHVVAPQPAQPVQPAEENIAAPAPADVDDSSLGPADQRYTIGQSVFLSERCNVVGTGKDYFPDIGVQGQVVAIPLLRSRGSGAIYRAYHVQVDGKQLILECAHYNLQAKTLGKRTSRSGGASPQQQQHQQQRQQQRKRRPNTANRDRAAAASGAALSGAESGGDSNHNASDEENDNEAEF
jgi:hypothetical protein